MAGKYSIYKLTSPSGRSYVGLTKTSVHVRWLNHVKRANTGKNHPLYNAIRKYGRENFIVETLETGLTEQEASVREKYHIPLLVNRYNISDGGETDGEFGSRIFWAKMNSDPEARAAYIAKLSETKLANDWVDYEAFIKKSQRWRKDNPKQAYKSSMRAIRIANRGRDMSPATEELSLKERLYRKHKNGEFRSKYVTKMWSERTEDVKKDVFDKISATTRAKHASKSEDELREMTSKARNSIDRVKQGAAASKGIKAYWVRLKEDPVAYKAAMDQRVKTRRANANV